MTSPLDQEKGKLSKRLVLSLVAIVIASIFAFQIISGIMMKDNKEPPLIVMRIDDIQDYAFRSAQLHLLEYNLDFGLPTSLAVISEYFGADVELVNLVDLSIKMGSEITAHGWKNLAEHNLDEQIYLLQLAKENLHGVLGIEVSILVPPNFDFNLDTLQAMNQTGYTIISSYVEKASPGSVFGEILSIPATVEFSDFVNGTWQPKTSEELLLEVYESVKFYGYAIITTHPQEFLEEGEFSQKRFDVYEILVRQLRETCSFTTIKSLQIEHVLISID